MSYTLKTDYKALAASMRATIKAAGFKAKVSVGIGGGFVAINEPAYEAGFTPQQIEVFCNEAIKLNMTFVQKQPIDIENCIQLTGRGHWEFY